MLPQFIHALLHIIQLAYMRVAATADFRGLAHKAGVGRRAYGHRKQPTVAQLLCNLLQQIRFVTHRTVGDKHNLPQQTGLDGQLHGVL